MLETRELQEDSEDNFRGTMRYMAPELFVMRHPHKFPEADIYSLAMTFWVGMRSTGGQMYSKIHPITGNVNRRSTLS